MDFFRHRMTAEERALGDLIHQGQQLLDKGQTAAACDVWLEAWPLVQNMVRPETNTTEAFDKAHRFGVGEFVSNWCQDVEMELGNAGVHDPRYHELRVQFAREFLALFPHEDDLMVLNFHRAEGEALWELGKREESEAVYVALVESQPDDAWAYIGWADQYWFTYDSPKEYENAVAVLKRALARPDLRDRADVFERLIDLYEEWGKPEEQERVQAEALEAFRQDETPAAPKPAKKNEQGAAEETLQPERFPPLHPLPLMRSLPDLGRNDPCWCGSGKKYKHCHWRSDRS